MLQQEKNPRLKGGILADAMGLGKTVQTLALLLTHHPSLISDDAHVAGGATLVVCPLSTLPQWVEELRKKAKGLRVISFYGRNRINDTNWLNRHDVVLTTYSTLSSDVSAKARGGGGVLSRIRWYRVVLDEAHLIKNPKAKCSRSAFSLESRHRWCITGTPLQNGIEDCYSLLHFLRLSNFRDRWWWEAHIMGPAKKGDPGVFLRLRGVLQTVMLRRTRHLKIGGTPIVSLPPCDIHVRVVEPSAWEVGFYRSLFTSAQAIYRCYVEQSAVQSNLMHMLELLLRLRQCCVHPLLVLFSAYARIVNNAFKPNALGGVSGNDTDCFNFKDALMIILNVLHPALPRDDVPGTHQPSALGDEKEGLPMAGTTGDWVPWGVDMAIKVLQGDAALEFASSAFRGLERVTRVEKEDACGGALPSSPPRVCGICLDEPCGDSLSAPCCNMVFCAPCIEAHMRTKECYWCPGCRTPSSSKRMTSSRAPPASPWASRVRRVRRMRVTPMQEHNARARSPRERRVVANSLEIARACALLSTKVQTVVNDVKSIKEGNKCLVFSQFTRTLDILELVLDAEAIANTRLDGTMSKQQRVRAINQFKSNPLVKVFLISLQAGGTGLNLVEANHVFIMDPWWNPSAEQQALDRVHRIGQTLPVTVVRYIIKGSVEESIMQLQRRKCSIVSGALHGVDAEVTSSSGLGLKDLEVLLS